MLISSITVVNTVISDPTQHTGDGFAGDLWLSELDVSGDITNYDDIAIGHCEAVDDWVKWTDGTGNISANWSTDIDSRDHPEMNVTYSLYIFLCEKNNIEVGNASIQRTISENSQYEQNGVLTVFLDFTGDIMQEFEEITLICKLDTIILHNATTEIQNLTCWAEDRAVIGVSFPEESAEFPFSRFLNESNDIEPIMWSYLDGWNNSGRFSSEDDMLNTQTFFKVGAAGLGSTGQTGWYLGEMEVKLYKTRSPELTFNAPSPANREYTVNPHPTTGFFDIECYMNVKVIRMEGDAPNKAWVRFFFWKESLTKTWYDLLWYPCYGSTVSTPVTTSISKTIRGNVWEDINDDDDVEMHPGLFWAFTRPVCKGNIIGEFYSILLDDPTGENTDNSQTNINWEDICAYNNGSYNLAVSNSNSGGITTISVNVSNALTNDELIYSFSGDSGDVKISFIC